MPRPNYRYDKPDTITDFLSDVPLSPLLMQAKSEGLAVTVTSPAGSDVLQFESLAGRDAISSPFEYHVRLYSTDAEVDLTSLLGEPFALTVASQEGDKEFYFSGIVTQARSLPSYIVDASAKSYIAFYHVVLRPDFWLTTVNKTSRIFVEKSAVDIIEEVLGEDSVTFSNKTNSAGKAVRAYCVQYNESNFNFVSRLMEEEGIFYFFEHSDSGATMVLADANKSTISIDPCDISVAKVNSTSSISLFNSQTQIVAKEFSAVDYDYMTPATLLKATGSGEGLGGEVYEYPGGYVDSDGASSVGTTRIAEISWPENLVFGEGSVFGFTAGAMFNATKHVRSDLNQKYVLYSVEHKLIHKPRDNNRIDRGRKLVYLNKFTALPFDIPFAPLRNTPKPKADGFQTAVVVGPSDKEIHCDEEGRVFVQFNWDKEGEKDGAIACPVRCMQGWAGNGFGLAFIPRIGMEVLVVFENGNPDLPVIVGCLYNGENKMPAEVTAEPRIAMLKTKTSPEKEENANVMSFDDTDENEKIMFNATKNFELSSIAKENIFLVKQEGEKTTNQLQITDGLLETTITKGEKTTTIEEGNYTIALKKGSLTITLDDGDKVVTLTKGNYIITCDDGELTITAKKDVSITTDAAMSITAQKDITLTSQASIILEATKDIELKATGEIKMTATKNISEKATADVIVEGMNIQQKATMDHKVEALNIAQKASMDHKIEGLNIAQKATVGWTGEGLTWGAKGTLEAKLEALMVACNGTIDGKYAGLMATLDGSVMSTTKGGAIAALKGGISMIG